MSEPRNVTWTDPALVHAIDSHPTPSSERDFGYGPKVPTRFRIKYRNQRWHRVYMMQYGNSGTAYIIDQGADLVLDSATEYKVECFSRGESPSQGVLDAIAKFSTL